MSKKKWMQSIEDNGSLSRALDIAQEDNIPMTLLTKIKNTEIGETVSNPTSTGKSSIKVTKSLKKKAVAAHNMKQA